MRFLFIAGCPRSGTTPIASLLNADERIVIGQERFRNSGGEIEPADFEPDAFFDLDRRRERLPTLPPSPGMFPSSPADYETLRRRVRARRVEVIGDKSPFHHRHLERLAAVFPDARVIVPWRSLEEVAASYERRARNPDDAVWPPENDWRLAPSHWLAAMNDARSFALAEPDRIHVLHFGRFFSGDTDEMLDLYSFIGLAPDPAVLALHAGLAEGAIGGGPRSSTVELDDDARRQLATRVDPALVAWLEERVAEQRVRLAQSRAAVP